MYSYAVELRFPEMRPPESKKWEPFCHNIMLTLLVPWTSAFRSPMLFCPDVDPLLGFSLNDQQAMRKISRMLHTHTLYS